MSTAEISITREQWQEIKETLLQASAEMDRLEKKPVVEFRFWDGSSEIERPEKRQSPRWSFWDGFFTGAGAATLLVVFLL